MRRKKRGEDAKIELERARGNEGEDGGEDEGGFLAPAGAPPPLSPATPLTPSYAIRYLLKYNKPYSVYY
jgi:hypothetical protein